MRNSLAVLALLSLVLPAQALPRDKAKELDEHLQGVTYALYSNGGLCAATMIDKVKGLLLTAAHCLRPNPLTGEKSHVVTIEGSRLSMRAKVVKVDEDKDLALVDVLIPLKFKDEAKILPSKEEVYRYQDVYTLGHPLGWAYTGSAGTVSFVHRAEGPTPVDQIQVDMTINHGNSGGGLFDEDGTLVGVMSWIVAKDEDSPGFGLNFAISYRAINEFLEDVNG